MKHDKIDELEKEAEVLDGVYTLEEIEDIAFDRLRDEMRISLRTGADDRRTWQPGRPVADGDVEVTSVYLPEPFIVETSEPQFEPHSVMRCTDRVTVKSVVESLGAGRFLIWYRVGGCQ